MSKANPLVAALAEVAPAKVGQGKKIDRFDADTKQAILAAAARGVSAEIIAETLTDAGQPITANPVRDYIRANQKAS